MAEWNRAGESPRGGSGPRAGRGTARAVRLLGVLAVLLGGAWTVSAGAAQAGPAGQLIP